SAGVRGCTSPGAAPRTGPAAGSAGRACAGYLRTGARASGEAAGSARRESGVAGTVFTPSPVSDVTGSRFLRGAFDRPPGPAGVGHSGRGRVRGGQPVRGCGRADFREGPGGVTVEVG